MTNIFFRSSANLAEDTQAVKSDKDESEQTIEQVLPVRRDRNGSAPNDRRRHRDANGRRARVRLRGVAGVPGQDRRIPVPDAHLGQRDADVEVRVRVDERNLDGADRRGVSSQVLELHVHDGAAERDPRVGRRAYELRGYRHEFPGRQHDEQAADQGRTEEEVQVPGVYE